MCVQSSKNIVRSYSCTDKNKYSYEILSILSACKLKGKNISIYM